MLPARQPVPAECWQTGPSEPFEVSANVSFRCNAVRHTLCLERTLLALDSSTDVDHAELKMLAATPTISSMFMPA
ncbi:hypothetical protein J2W42_004432 [Rhizobium tibeticum]|nr:hypothetical protein [Rhizobium tibeticum]